MDLQGNFLFQYEMKFTIDETKFNADHSIILSDQYQIDSSSIVFKIEQSGKELYVNWNGFISQMPMENIGINAELIRSLGWKHGDTVDMTVADSCLADWITVIPKSLKDWHIIELQAEFLEDQILAQICVVSKGMEIPLRTRDGGLVRVVVDSVSPETTGALKLASGVEIRIVPLKKVEAFTKELRLIPNYFKKSWSKIYMSSSDCQLQDQIVKVNIIPFLKKKKSVDIYAIVEISEDSPKGNVMFSHGFDFMGGNYEIVRYNSSLTLKGTRTDCSRFSLKRRHICISLAKG